MPPKRENGDFYVKVFYPPLDWFHFSQSYVGLWWVWVWGLTGRICWFQSQYIQVNTTVADPRWWSSISENEERTLSLLPGSLLLHPRDSACPIQFHSPYFNFLRCWRISQQKLRRLKIEQMTKNFISPGWHLFLE